MTGWRVLRAATLVGFVGVGVGLVFGGERAAILFWSGFVPLLPAVFLVSPELWRNVCPLATLGQGGAVEADGPRREVLPVLPGILALFLLIALRGSVLGESGPATAGLLASLALVATVRGRSSPGKSGFCNRLCPVLPVERLYGQSPLLEVGNARCGPCDLCAPRGCLDLNPRSAIPQVLGASRHGHGWLTRPFGVFAAAFPGVVWSFSRLPIEAHPAGAALTLALGAFVSWLIAAAVVRALDLGWRVAIPTLGAVAAAMHLWTALPALLDAWGLAASVDPVRYVALAAVAGWWLRALDSPRRGRLVSIATHRRR